MEEYLRRNPAGRDFDLALKHMRETHTSLEDVARVATAARVKTLVLSHIVPGAAPELTDQMLMEGASRIFPGKVIVGKDLMEI